MIKNHGGINYVSCSKYVFFFKGLSCSKNKYLRVFDTWINMKHQSLKFNFPAPIKKKTENHTKGGLCSALLFQRFGGFHVVSYNSVTIPLI